MFIKKYDVINDEDGFAVFVVHGIVHIIENGHYKELEPVQDSYVSRKRNDTVTGRYLQYNW